MKRLWMISLLFFISIASFAQTINTVKLDSLFNHLHDKQLAMGAIFITENGKPVYQRSFGKDHAATATYRIGSITKVFTAVMIYELIDQKKLSLKDTLSRFFPGLPHAGKISIADMLGHRSGLANFTAAKTNFDAWKEQPHTHEQLLDFISSQSPDFLPGTKADYNNSNYLLLGYILEKIYRQPYKDIVKNRIVRPLGLQDTYYGDSASFRGKEVASYKYFNHQWHQDKAVYLDNFSGAGALLSTPQDMGKFIKAVFDGKIISKSARDRMIKIEKDGYGWGLFPFGDSLHTGYGHNGKTEGFASSLQYYPQKKLAISYCTNGEVYPKDIILKEVWKICFDEPVTIPTFNAVTVSEQQLQPLIGTYAGDNGLQVIATVVNGRLVLETKGQQFALEAMSDRRFRNIPFGFFFFFDKAGRELEIHDASVTYRLHKQ